MKREKLRGLKWKDIEFNKGLIVLNNVHVKAGNRNIYKSNLKNSNNHRK